MTAMIIDIQKISENGTTYSGELPKEAMDLEGEKFIRPHGPVTYELTAELVSDQLIVRGWVETVLDLMCVVCADFFSTKVAVSSFLRAYPIQTGLETIDLTDDIREELLLVVPYYPRGETDEQERCIECGRRVAKEHSDPDADQPSDVWDPLNRLKL